MANALSHPKFEAFATTAGEGEVWAGKRGCRVTLRENLVIATRLLEGGPLFKGSAQPSPALAAALGEVGHYLSGERRHFSVPVYLDGPPFYRLVWETLRHVPYGKTVTYGELAALAGSPGSARAVGSAMRKNPLLLFVPCHRVTGSGGKLGGFSSGTAWKKFLIELESRASSLEFKA